MSCFNIVLGHLDIEILGLLKCRLIILKLLIYKILFWILNVDVSLFIYHVWMVNWLRSKCIIDSSILMIYDTILVKYFRIRLFLFFACFFQILVFKESIFVLLKLLGEGIYVITFVWYLMLVLCNLLLWLVCNLLSLWRLRPEVTFIVKIHIEIVNLTMIIIETGMLTHKLLVIIRINY